MKTCIHRLAQVRHAVYGNVLMGAVMTIAGLFQASQALMVGGICWILVSITVLVLTHLVSPVLEGEIVVLQQPQLPDVQTHMRRTPELTQAV